MSERETSDPVPETSDPVPPWPIRLPKSVEGLPFAKFPSALQRLIRKALATQAVKLDQENIQQHPEDANPALAAESGQAIIEQHPGEPSVTRQAQGSLTKIEQPSETTRR